MKHSKLLEGLQNLIGFTPKQSDLCKILGYGYSTIGARAQRDSEYTDEEIEQIENFYGIAGRLRGGNADCVELDYYPEVFGSCGHGTFVVSESKERIALSKSAFMSFSPVKKYSVINACGCSMEPTISDKDKLIVEHWEGEQIHDNKVYVFCYKDELYVKRLIKNINELIIRSDNPDPMYRPQFIEKDEMNDVLIIGEIVGLLRDMS